MIIDFLGREIIIAGMNVETDSSRLSAFLDKLVFLHELEETCLSQRSPDSPEMSALRKAINSTYFDCVRMGGKEEAIKIILRDCTRIGQLV